MAGGPYKGSGGWFHCKWSDKLTHPEHPKKTESLKSTNRSEAKTRLSILETLYNNNYHDPWELPWYKNSQIKHIVYSGYLDLSALKNGTLSSKALTLYEGAEQYKSFKQNQRGTRKGWKSPRTIKTHSQTIDKFVEFIGPHVRINSLAAEDLDKFYQRPAFASDYTKVAARARINGMLNYFADKNYLNKNIDAEVDPPQTEIKRYVRKETMLDIFSKMEELATTAEDNKHTSYMHETLWYADFCRMSYDTGLRGIEQIKLKTYDITPSDIMVGNSFKVKTNFQRKVAIGEGLARQVINKYTDPEFRKEDMFLKRTPYLFGRSSEKTRARISSALKEASLEVAPELKGLTLQDLRHISAMKWLIENKDIDEGFRIIKLMHRMGHKQLTTTQGYLNFLPSDGVI